MEPQKNNYESSKDGSSSNQSKRPDFQKKLGDGIERTGEMSVKSNSSHSSQTQDWVGEVSDRLSESASDLESKITQLLKKRPFLFVAGALAVGYIANRILTASSSESSGSSRERASGSENNDRKMH